MNRCTEDAVRLVFDRLEKRLGTYEFISVFEYLLTDRGSEFGDPDALETGIDGMQRTSIYYCDLMRSGQKDVWNRRTPCFAWYSRKEPVLNSLLNGM